MSDQANYTGAAIFMRSLITLHRITLDGSDRLANDLRFVVTKLGELDDGEAERLPARLVGLDKIGKENECRRSALDIAEEFAAVLDAPGDDAEKRLDDLQRRLEQLAEEEE